MKIKKTLLALLLSSSAFLLAGSLGAQELPVAEVAEVVETVTDAVSFEDGYAAFMETPGAASHTWSFQADRSLPIISSFPRISILNSL